MSIQSSETNATTSKCTSESSIYNEIVSVVDLPLVVDLDGTLTATDTLIESIIKLIKQSPFKLAKLFFWLLQGRAVLKSKVAASTTIDASLLPYNDALLEYLQNEKRRGRKIILATAAHTSIAGKVAKHLDLFDEVLSTEGNINLKSEEKLKAIRDQVGTDFVYAGDSVADIPIWKAAKAAIIVGVPPNLAYLVRKHVPIEKEFARIPIQLGDWLKAFRVHQWLKNLLLFVPVSHHFRSYQLLPLCVRHSLCFRLLHQQPIYLTISGI